MTLSLTKKRFGSNSRFQRLKQVFSRKKPVRVVPFPSNSLRVRRYHHHRRLNDDLVQRRKRASALPLLREASTLERYMLNEPHAYAKIVQDPFKGTIRYQVLEPELTEEEQQHLVRLKNILTEVLELNINETGTQLEAVTYLREQTLRVLDNYAFKVNNFTKEKLLYYIIRDNFGFGKIDPLMRDPFIEDISCDGTDINIYVWNRRYEYLPTNVAFDNDELTAFALRLAYLCGRHVSIAQPILDASLPGGSRIHLTYGTEVTRRGSTFTIRKFKMDPLTITDLINFNTVSAEMAAYFWYIIENRVSIIVSGGIASGKTTLLNCLSMFIKPLMKIVSIEDTPELNLPHENWVPTNTRSHFGLETERADITLFDLLRASLRQRPDYIIVGEVRGTEAYTLFQAISTGHLGMSTIHAESIEAVVYRLESEPMNIPRTMISGIDVITIQRRVEVDGEPVRKTVMGAEIVGLDPRSREILTNEVYKWNALSDQFEFTGRSYVVERIAEKQGITIEAAYEEIERRAEILEWMAKNDIRDYRAVSEIIRRYYLNPNSVFVEATRSG
jgi:flagellar protein FlaI